MGGVENIKVVHERKGVHCFLGTKNVWYHAGKRMRTGTTKSNECSKSTDLRGRGSHSLVVVDGALVHWRSGHNLHTIVGRGTDVSLALLADDRTGRDASDGLFPWEQCADVSVAAKDAVERGELLRRIGHGLTRRSSDRRGSKVVQLISVLLVGDRDSSESNGFVGSLTVMEADEVEAGVDAGRGESGRAAWSLTVVLLIREELDGADVNVGVVADVKRVHAEVTIVCRSIEHPTLL